LSNLVYSAAADKEGNLWFGCKNPNGVSRFNGKRWENFTTRNCGIASGHIWDIAVDDQGMIWFGTAGGGLSRYNGESWENFTMRDGLAGNHVYVVKVDNHGKLWCGCAPKPDSIVKEGGVSIYDGRKFTNYSSDFSQGQYVGGGNSELCDNRVYSIVFDKAGHAWFGTKGGGICSFDGRNWKTFNESDGLPVNEVGEGAAALDLDGNVWFGLRGGGACQFVSKDFRIFTMKEGLAGNFIYAIQQGPDGKLWFGCSPDPEIINREGGISIYDGVSFTNYTSAYAGGIYIGGGNCPLTDNRVYAIVFDNAGNGWIGTKGGGVSRISHETIRRWF